MKEINYRFEIAFSFAGNEKRDRICEIAKLIQSQLRPESVFYDQWFEFETAGPDANQYLQNIYRHETRLVVVIFCDQYLQKQWTQDEWRAIQDFERSLRGPDQPSHQRNRFLMLRFGDVDLSKLYSTTLIPDITDESDKGVAEFILRRHKLTFAGSPTAPVYPDISSSNLAQQIFMAPNRRQNVVPRHEEFARLVEQILSGHSTAITSALQGLGGVGKTTMALELCHDSKVKDAFEDGVLWVELGKKPVLTECLTQLILALSPATTVKQDVDSLQSELKALLTSKRCLLVVDDVWELEHLDCFEIGPNCALLYTTRRSDIVSMDSRIADGPVAMDAMSPDEAISLLSVWQNQDGDIPHDVRQVFEMISQRLNHHSLSLALAAQRIRKDVRQFGMTLIEAGKKYLTDIETFGTESSIQSSIALSVEEFDDETKQRLYELAVFPEDTFIPVETIQRFWDLTEQKAAVTLERFADASLVMLNKTNQTVQLHDIIRDFTISQHHDLKSLHKRLLDSWGDFRQITSDYAWRWVCAHLRAAGNTDQLVDLLTDPNWCLKRLMKCGPAVFLSDFSRLTEQEAPGANDIRNAFILALREDIGYTQVMMDVVRLQLQGKSNALVDQFLQRLDQVPTMFSLAAVTPFVDARSTKQLLHTLVGHTAKVNAVVYNDQHKIVASGGQDETIRIWDLNDQGNNKVLTYFKHSSNDGESSTDKELNAVFDFDSIQWTPISRLQIYSNEMLLAFARDDLQVFSLPSGEALKPYGISLFGKHEYGLFSRDETTIVFTRMLPEWKTIVCGVMHSDTTPSVIDMQELWNSPIHVRKVSRSSFGLRTKSFSDIDKLTALDACSANRLVAFSDFSKLYSARMCEPHEAEVRNNPVVDLVFNHGHRSQDDEKPEYKFGKGNDSYSSYSERLDRWHEKTIREIRFNADGSRLMTIDRSGYVVVWKSDLSEQIVSCTTNCKVNCTWYFASDDTVLALNEHDEVIKISFATAEIVERKKLSPLPIRKIYYDDDAKTLLIANSASQLIVYRWESNDSFSIETGHEAINTMCLGENGKIAVTGGEDRKVKVWDVGSLRQPDVAPLIDIAAADNAELVIGVDSRGSVMMQKNRQSTPILNLHDVSRVEIERNGATAYFVESGSNVLAWDTNRRRELFRHQHECAVREIAIGELGNQVVFLDEQHRLHYLSTPDHFAYCRQIGEDAHIVLFAIDPKKNRVAFLCGKNNELHLWDLRSDVALASVAVPEELKNPQSMHFDDAHITVVDKEEGSKKFKIVSNKRSTRLNQPYRGAYRSTRTYKSKESPVTFTCSATGVAWSAKVENGKRIRLEHSKSSRFFYPLYLDAQVSLTCGILTRDGRNLVFGGADGQIHRAEIRGLLVDLKEATEHATKNDDPIPFTNLLNRTFSQTEKIVDEYERQETLELLVDRTEKLIRDLLENDAVESSIQITAAITIEEVRKELCGSILWHASDELPPNSANIDQLGHTIQRIPQRLGFVVLPDSLKPEFAQALSRVAFDLAELGSFEKCEHWLGEACAVLDEIDFEEDEDLDSLNQVIANCGSLIYGVGCKALPHGRGRLAEWAIQQGEAILQKINVSRFQLDLLASMIDSNLKVDRIEAASDLVKFYLRRIEENRTSSANHDRIRYYAVGTHDLDTVDRLLELKQARTVTDKSAVADHSTVRSLQKARIQILTNTDRLQDALEELSQLRNELVSKKGLPESDLPDSDLLDLYLELSVKLCRNQQLEKADEAVLQAGSLLPPKDSAYRYEESLERIMRCYSKLLTIASPSDTFVSKWQHSAVAYLHQYLTVEQLGIDRLPIAVEVLSGLHFDRNFFDSSLNQIMELLPSAEAQVWLISELVVQLEQYDTAQLMVELLDRASKIIDTNPDMDIVSSGFAVATAVVSGMDAIEGNPEIALNRISEFESLVTEHLDHSTRSEYGYPASYNSAFVVAGAYATIIAEFGKRSELGKATELLGKIQDSLLVAMAKMYSCEHLLSDTLSLFENSDLRTFALNNLCQLADEVEEFQSSMPDVFVRFCGHTYFLLLHASLVCFELGDQDTARDLVQMAKKYSEFDRAEPNFNTELALVVTLISSGQIEEADRRMKDCQLALDQGLKVSDPDLLEGLFFHIENGSIISATNEDDFEQARLIVRNFSSMAYISGGWLTIAFAYSMRQEGTLAVEAVNASHSAIQQCSKIPEWLKRHTSDMKNLVIAALKKHGDFKSAGQLESIEF